MEIRTRFAPSPTGYLHLGGLRTALFCWLWAKKNKGSFILRLEDTDQARVVKGAKEQLMQDLQGLGLDWDFGPDKPHPQFGSCVQSQRLKHYQKIAQDLVQKGLAYYDYTPSEKLKKLREEAHKKKRPFIFRQSMAQTQPEHQGQKAVVRVAIPADLKLTWKDAVKGEQSWSTNDINDLVLLKSDGWPTYHLACVVDDHLMEISHVIRADEWLSSTPIHLYLFDALGWQRPVFAHVPPILAGDSGRKLSKRDHSARVSELLKAGYLPQAVLNYLSLIGWNPKTEQEIFSIQELIQSFDISNIQVGGARFDIQRLEWFNGQHLRALSDKDRQKQAESWWPEAASSAEQDYKNQVLELVYQRLRKWSELPEVTGFFFKRPAPTPLNTLIKQSKLQEDQIKDLLKATLDLLKDSDFSLGDLELKLYTFAQDKQVSRSKYFTLLRWKLTGQGVAPGLFATMHVLGKEEACTRLNAGLM